MDEREQRRRARIQRDGNTYVWLIVVGVIVAGLVATVIFRSMMEDRPSSPAPTAESAVDQLRRRINAGPITASEQRDLEEALNERYPQGSRVLGHTSFYFDAGATSCGRIRARGTGPILRYVYRNNFAMIEGDVAPADFTPFWQICEAGGAS